MGKAASKVSRVFGLAGKAADGEQNESLYRENMTEGKSNRWDTTIDQLFGDAPSENPIDEPIEEIDEPTLSKPTRRKPPAPPSILDIPYERPRRRRLPSSPNRTRRRTRPIKARPIRTNIVSDHPRKPARRNLIAVNSMTSLGKRSENRRSIRKSRSRIILQDPCPRTSSLRRRPSFSYRAQRLQELLQCPVCLNPYNEPRLLPCGHTFCDECLNRLISNEQDVVTCPVCRKEHLVPDDGIFTPNFIVRNLLEQGPIDFDRISKSSKCSSGRTVKFFVAVRKITRSHSQVKRLTIEMPMGNYLRETCDQLIRRISEREEFDTPYHQFVLEFGEKRLRPQRTLSSYGINNGDLLFLFNPEQRLSFLAYQDDQSSPPQDFHFRSSTSESDDGSDEIRTVLSNPTDYSRIRPEFNRFNDEEDSNESLSQSDR